MSNEVIQARAEMLKALAHPTRISIVEFLRYGERCVCEIVDGVNVEQSGVSQHLAVLKKTGIVSFRKEGLRVIYRVEHKEVLGILDLLDDIISNRMKETAVLLDKIKAKK